MKLPIAITLAAFAASVTLVPLARAAQTNNDTTKCGEEKKEEKKKGEDKS